MLTFLILLLLLSVPETIAKQGSSSSGTHFVIGIPKPLLNFKNNVKLYITTYELKASFTLQKPSSITTGKAERSDNRFTIKRFGVFNLDIKTNYFMPDTGIYNALVLKANLPVKVFVRWVESEIHDHIGNADIFDLASKEICDASYHVSTTIGTPFIVVAAFDEGASLLVTFPNFKSKFNEKCSGDVNCAPGKTVAINLGPYKVWYFRLDDKRGVHFDLHNTLIKSDKPLFAVSGNLLCQMEGKLLTDMCSTTPKPKHAWGKEYVVPFFGHRTHVVVRFSAESYPFKFKIVKFSNTDEKTAENDLFYIKIEISHPFILTSSQAFSGSVFYALTEGKADSFSMASQCLLPTAQWTQGSVRVFHLKNYYTINFNVFIVSTVKEVEKFGGKKVTIAWKELKSEKHTYFYGWIEDDGSFSVRASSNGRLMIYITYVPIYYTCTIRNLDFFQGVINDPSCKASQPKPSDGVDNDCDGTIDEEEKNGKDDDKDGKVDEDIILSAGGNSTWTAWGSCEVTCDGKKITRKYRTCKIAAYAEDCKGDAEICDPGLHCPKGCDVKSQTCNCLTNCDQCNNKTGICDVCKPGFVSSDFCQTQCPEGWTGLACAEAVEEEKKGDTFNWLLLIIPLAAVPAVAACLILFAKKKKRESEVKSMEEVVDEEGQEAEEENKDNEHDEEEEEGNGEDKQNEEGDEDHENEDEEGKDDDGDGKGDDKEDSG